MAPRGRSGCEPARSPSPRAPRAGLPAPLCWVCGGESRPRPARGGTSRPPSLSRFLFPFLQPGRGPCARPAGPLCPAPAGRPSPCSEDRRGRCPFRARAERGAREGDSGPPGIPRGFLSVPHRPPWGRGQGKFAPKFSLDLFKGLAAARSFPLFRLHPLRLRVSSHSFPFTGFDCLTACVCASSPGTTVPPLCACLC